MVNKDQLLQDIINFKNDFKWFLDEYDKLKGKVILVKDKKIMIVATSMEEVKKKASGMNIDVSKSVIQFIPEKEITMII